MNEASTGVRHGDELSSSFFIVALNMGLEGTAEKEISFRNPNNCVYADHIVLVTRIIQNFKKYYLHWKLKADKWTKHE